MSLVSAPLPCTQFASTDRVELVKVFNYLEFCLTQVVKDNELGALREVRAGHAVPRGVRPCMAVGPSCGYTSTASFTARRLLWRCWFLPAVAAGSGL
jgi:hypothetical protein